MFLSERAEIVEWLLLSCLLYITVYGLAIYYAKGQLGDFMMSPNDYDIPRDALL